MLNFTNGAPHAIWLLIFVSQSIDFVAYIFRLGPVEMVCYVNISNQFPGKVQNIACVEYF